MANPQKENGYTAIANEILEAICNSGLNGTELAVLFFIIRKTYGFNKKQDEISLTQFEHGLPYTRRAIIKALKVLKLVNILTLVNKGSSVKIANSYRLNKDYEKWQLVNKHKLVNKRAQTSEQKGKQLVNKGIPTKDNIQKTITKDSISKPFKKIKIEKGINPEYDSFIDLTEKRKLVVQIVRVRFMEMREEYKLKIPWWAEVQKCVNWCYDNNKKFITTSRLRNWMQNAIKFNKDKEIKRLQEKQDAEMAKLSGRNFNQNI